MFGGYKKFESHDELKKIIGSLIEATNSLPYTETSKSNQNMIYIGFYQGYCYVSDWDIDYNFIFGYLSPLPISTTDNKPKKSEFKPLSDSLFKKSDKDKDGFNVPVTTPNTLHVKPIQPPSGIPDFLKDFDWSKHRN